MAGLGGRGPGPVFGHPALQRRRPNCTTDRGGHNDGLAIDPDRDLGRVGVDRHLAGCEGGRAPAVPAVAAAMGDRQRRISERAAAERPLWATRALGEFPAGPASRDGGATAGQLGANRDRLRPAKRLVLIVGRLSRSKHPRSAS